MDVFQIWKDATKDPLANTVVMIFLLICLILVAVYVVNWFRNLAIGRGDDSMNSLAEIERLKVEGKISQFEYLRLKKTAAEALSGKQDQSRKAKQDGEKTKEINSGLNSNFKKDPTFLHQRGGMDRKMEKETDDPTDWEPDFTETDNGN